MPYKFEQATSPGNFITKYVEYASKCCDASYEFHEAHALSLLSAASYGLMLDLPIHPGGLRPNLYFLIVGSSSFTRKSTAMKIAKELQRRSIPSCIMPADFTPGGLEASLEEMSPGPALLHIDEFKGLFVKMHKQQYMAGIRQMFLTLYDEDSHIYRKANKKGKTDIVAIEDVSFSMAGNITPSFINELQVSDIEDGFLARYAIVYPQDKPKRISIDKIRQPDIRLKNNLVMHLSKLLERMLDLNTGDNIKCKIEPEAMKQFDEFTKKIELTKFDELYVTLIERLSTMLIKVSMLAAIGDVDVDTFTDVTITKDHVDQALIIVNRWKAGVERFTDKLGSNKFEIIIQKLHTRLVKEGKMSRSLISRTYKLTQRDLNELQMTLIERNMITLENIYLEGASKATLFLVNNKEYKGDVAKV